MGVLVAIPLPAIVAIPFWHHCCHTFLAPLLPYLLASMLPYLSQAFVAIPFPTRFFLVLGLAGALHDARLTRPGHVRCRLGGPRHMKKNLRLAIPRRLVRPLWDLRLQGSIFFATPLQRNATKNRASLDVKGDQPTWEHPGPSVGCAAQSIGLILGFAKY